MKIIECVPNFSEGKNIEVINSIKNEISRIDEISLLDVDMGKDTNRTVITFIGPPDSVIQAAFYAIKTASSLIDMNKHTGEHPRMGATDVCPLIPVSNVTMDECIQYSKILAKKVGERLNIPVFLYEDSSSKKYRRNLSDIRKGEYEGMKSKLKQVKWKPDYGPNKFNIKNGVTAIGARNYLIAYNINLNTKDKKIATDIALDVREAGRAKRDSTGKILRDKNGNILKKPGNLKHTKAVGWYIDEYKKAQVSLNLINYKKTPIHKVFEEVRLQARKRGLRVTGSEIIGLVPKDSLINAGIYYLKKQNISIALPDEEILLTAIQSLGLNEIEKFDINNSIIENRISNKNQLLSNMTLKEFTNEISIDSPAPGGGSVSALAGSLSSALNSMVSNLSFNKKGYSQNNAIIEKLGVKSQKIKKKLLILVDEDTKAFNSIMDTYKLPKKTDKEIIYRNKQIQIATKFAISVPLQIMEFSLESLILSKKISEIGNIHSISDSGVSGELAYSAINGAYMNVLINLKDMTDKLYIKNMKNKANTMINRSKKEISLLRSRIYDIL